MLINKFTKKKNGQYEIELENDEKIVVHEDLILKYNLLINKKINDKEKENILNENTLYIARDKAIKYVSTKMRSIKELESYILDNDIDKTLVIKIIKELKEKKYLDDALYTKAFINDKINLSNDGPYKIARDLEKKGVVHETIWDIMKIFDDSIQIEKITKLVNKFKKSNKNKSAMMLKNKIVNYLTNLGYEKSIVISCIEKEKIDIDSNIIKKEYEKVYKKVSKKYEGKELEYKIKEKMYSLGFNDYTIDN